MVLNPCEVSARAMMQERGSRTHLSCFLFPFFCAVLSEGLTETSITSAADAKVFLLILVSFLVTPVRVV